MRTSPPESASALTLISSVVARTRPPPLISLSASTAIPSMNHGGCTPFGIQIFPKMAFATRGTPSMVSRWRMCVYSCSISSATQSSKSLMVDRGSGVAAYPCTRS